MGRPLPKWMRAHVARCCAAFGLDAPGYRLYITRQKRVNGDKAIAGYTYSAARYHRAHVRFRKQQPTDRYEVVTHELLHAALGRQGEAVDIIVAQLPKHQRALALETWHAANEAAITQVARALTPILQKEEPPRD